jgi:hydroxyethylthiazole kinase-like uncharacterized protein yjeF
MKIVSGSEMRAIDHATSERFHIPSLTLMEDAGSAVTRFIVGNYPQAERIGIICGKGNNGGDGFVAARKLSEAGRAARVLLLADPKELRGDAAIMFEHMKLTPVIAATVADLESPEAAEIFASDLIVDAILGTGFRPPVSELYAAAIAKMNASASPSKAARAILDPITSSPILAVDIPSGADADADIESDKDKPHAGAIARADAIVTFTAPRPAHVFAGLTNGPTVVAPIGSPDEAISSALNLRLSTPADFRSLLAPRQNEANKGSYGHVLVIGGSLGKAGAAAMAGFSALRAGAGLSTVATPKSVLPTVASFHPEIMTEPLPETADGTINEHAFDFVVPALTERKTVIAIGPGISRNIETSEFVRSLLTSGKIPKNISVVIDADALNAFEGAADKLNGRGRHIVITPHPGEMSRLTGLSIAEIQANRLDVARKFARDHHLVVVLKGHRTLVASPDGAVWVNATGNPGMATGGTGDILTGIVAGLIAQHPQNVLLATALAVYLHGLAGDLASESLGEHSLVATDLVRFLPESFRQASASVDSAEFRFHA